MEDSKEKGKKGLCILAAAKKKPFLADSKFLKIRALPYAMSPTMAFSCGICHLGMEQRGLSSGNVLSIHA